MYSIRVRSSFSTAMLVHEGISPRLYKKVKWQRNSKYFSSYIGLKRLLLTGNLGNMLLE